MDQCHGKTSGQLRTMVASSSGAAARHALDHNKYQGLALALFHECEDALVLFDAKTRHILDLNIAAQRLCGIGLCDLLDTPVSSLFRAQGQNGLGTDSLPNRKVQLPHVTWGIELRTFQEDVWLSVDLTLTRLAVKPQPLVLLTIRECRTEADCETLLDI
jgi:hypothetical protein